MWRPVIPLLSVFIFIYVVFSTKKIDFFSDIISVWDITSSFVKFVVCSFVHLNVSCECITHKWNGYSTLTLHADAHARIVVIGIEMSFICELYSFMVSRFVIQCPLLQNVSVYMIPWRLLWFLSHAQPLWSWKYIFKVQDRPIHWWNECILSVCEHHFRARVALLAQLIVSYVHLSCVEWQILCDIKADFLISDSLLPFLWSSLY